MCHHTKLLGRAALLGLALTMPPPLMAQEAQTGTGTATTEPATGAAAGGQVLTAPVAGPEGTAMGSVTAAAQPSGQMLLTIELTGLPPGIHGVHVHQTGSCEAADFESAGDHLADGMKHGIMVEDGPHPGDLPNIHVPDSGEVTIEYFTPTMTPALMTDDDGSAFIVHADPDDYSGQPSGNAGDRIACGVFAAGG